MRRLPDPPERVQTHGLYADVGAETEPGTPAGMAREQIAQGLRRQGCRRWRHSLGRSSLRQTLRQSALQSQQAELVSAARRMTNPLDEARRYSRAAVAGKLLPH